MIFKLKYFIYILPALILVLVLIVVKTYNQRNCVITPATLNAPQIENSTVNLSWMNGQNTEGSYINISTSNSLNSEGLFSEPANIANDAAQDKTSYTRKKLKPGTYFWNVISNGCGRTKVSSLSSFIIEENSEAKCNIAPPVLNTPVIKERSVVFNWTNDKNAEASYINASTSNELDSNGFLKKIDIANDVVTDQTSFIKENLLPGTYYWNIVSDGCDQRKISNLGSFTIQ